jgi:3-hydroxyisobutyrate dehydrogenase-like beta-hydroxyacid dehydrogenase
MKVGFIGLGIMGSRMAAHLLHRDHELIVFNRTRAKADSLRKEGASVADSPAQLATQVDLVFTMLSEPAAVEEVALGSEGFLDRLDPRTIWVDCSTVSPSFSKEMARQATARGVRFLDAPVTGSAPVAAGAQLQFWVGGDVLDFDRVRWLLLYMGSRAEHVGPTGAGSAMKLVFNMLLGAGMAAFAEATVFGESLGLDRSILFQFLAGMPQVAPFLVSKQKKIETENFEAEFPLAWMQKDLHLAALTAFESGVAMPLTNSAKELYRLAMRDGHARDDLSAVYAFLAGKHKHQEIAQPRQKAA